MTIINVIRSNSCNSCLKKAILISIIPIIVLSCKSREGKRSAQYKDTAAMTYGIDISKYQGDEVDFLKRKKDTLTFIICKATEGITVVDSSFRNNWTMAKEKGFTRGSYHFYHCQDDTSLQAQHFFSVVGSLDSNDLCPIVDFEETSVAGCEQAGVQVRLAAFLNQVEKLFHRKPMIYTDYNTAHNYLREEIFSNYPLYIAAYTKSGSPTVPALWYKEGWTIWQKTDSLKLNGNYNDFDVYNGNKAQLKNFIRYH